MIDKNLLVPGKIELVPDFALLKTLREYLRLYRTITSNGSTPSSFSGQLEEAIHALREELVIRGYSMELVDSLGARTRSIPAPADRSAEPPVLDSTAWKRRSADARGVPRIEPF